MLPSMFCLICAVAYNSYYVELQDKVKFLNN